MHGVPRQYQENSEITQEVINSFEEEDKKILTRAKSITITSVKWFSWCQDGDFKIRYYLAPEEARLLLSKEATNYQSIKHSNRHDQAGFLKLRNEKLSTQI